MNLNDYLKQDRTRTQSAFITFKENGETKYLRFLYESGGDTIGHDIVTRRKHWNAETKKYEYGTEQGTLTCTLDAIEYDADGSNPRRVKWDRSAYFCSNTLIPMWKNYPRIIDGVWRITASNPTTMEATYTLFPVMNADSIKYPIDLQEEKDAAPAVKASPTPAATPGNKYWEA